MLSIGLSQPFNWIANNYAALFRLPFSVLEIESLSST